MMKYSKDICKALKIAYKAHDGQVDKCGMPYIFHPFCVAQQLENEDEITTALLHDVAEDTDIGINELKTENMFFTGYISDGQIKSLMSHCKAFIHPAIYEGFGIPPLEAMSCGATLILSTATCLPEIYGKSAHYIDPYCYDIDLDVIVQEHVEKSQIVLEKYNWSIEAKKLLHIIQSV